MVSRGIEEPAFCEWQSFREACHGARAVAAPTALRQRIGAPRMSEGAEDFEVGEVVVEDRLPLLHRFVERICFQAEASKD